MVVPKKNSVQLKGLNAALNGFCKASLVAAPAKDLADDNERVRVGRTQITTCMGAA